MNYFNVSNHNKIMSINGSYHMNLQLSQKQITIEHIQRFLRTNSLESTKLSTQYSSRNEKEWPPVSPPSPPTNNAMFHPSRYKIEFCKNMAEMGKCEFGERCLYAHSMHELRPCTYRHHKFKTELCKPFHEVGFCEFGSRCSFIHSMPDLQSLLKYFDNQFMTKIPMPENLNRETNDMSTIQMDTQLLLSAMKQKNIFDDESDLLPSIFNGFERSRLPAFVKFSSH